MASTTPNLGLYKPGGGSTGLITPDEVVDVDRFNTNSDLLDAFAGTTNTKLAKLRNETPGMVLADIGVVTGGTKNSQGGIEFENASLVAIQNCFSGKYRDYKMFIDLNGSVQGTLGLQLLNNATPVTSDYFQGGIGLAGNNTPVGYHGNASTVPLMPSGVNQLMAEVLVGSPAISGMRARFQVNAYGQWATSQAHTFNGGAIQDASTARNGIRLITGGGGMELTGTIYIYGLVGRSA